MNIQNLSDFLPQSLGNRLQQPLQNAPAQGSTRPDTFIEQRLDQPGRSGQLALRFSLNKHLILGQERFPGMSSTLDQAYVAKPDTFDIQSVVRNVLDFVIGQIRQASGNGQNQSLVDQMMAEARTGIVSGFQEAKDILNNTGIMNDALEEGIDKSYEFIEQGLKSFAQGGSEQALSAANTYAARVGQLQSGSLSLYTRDGDKVVLSFEDSMQSGYQQSADGATYALSLSSRFNLSVEGEIDDGERQAITDFLDDLDQLANEFFSGDLDVAFENAAQLQLDESELASFALNLSQVQTVQVQQVYSGGESTPIQTAMGALSNYLNTLKESMLPIQADFAPEAQKEMSDLVVALRTGLQEDILVQAQENFYSFNINMLSLIEQAQTPFTPSDHQMVNDLKS